MAEVTASLANLVGELSKLPGVGKKSAERMAYHLLKVEVDEAMRLAEAIRDLKENVRYCHDCFHLSEQERCEICRDTQRQQRQLCVVEQSRDLLMIEQSGVYHGLYHVLLGRLSPLDRVGPEHLTLENLLHRITSGAFDEVILATNPTLEGDATALYITERVSHTGVSITRLARGITSGSELQFANKEMLADAINGRQNMARE